MGKTFKSYDKLERFDYHDYEDNNRKKKLKHEAVKKSMSTHKDRKSDQLAELDKREDE